MDNTQLNEDTVTVRTTSLRNKMPTSGHPLVPSTSSVFVTLYVIGSFLLNGIFNPFFKRGFFCNDSSINYPIKSDTVSFGWLLVVALVVPALIIRICDKQVKKLLSSSSGPSFRRKQSSQQSEGLDVERKELISATNSVKRRLVLNDDDSDYEPTGTEKVESDCNSEQSGEVNLFNRLHLEDEGLAASCGLSDRKRTLRTKDFLSPIVLSDVQVFLFGLATTSFFTGLGKTTCGRFRPHFLQRCRPNVDCTAPANMFRYIEQFNCTNELRPRDINYISTSWPSGHASMSFFSSFFLIAYLHMIIPVIAKLGSRRRARRLDPIVLNLIYVMIFGVASFISLTRISDYHHHPTDVLSGSIIGSIIAILTTKFTLKEKYERLNN